ncbi:MAG: bifunctional nuclease family protein [Muribaculaceae bacterium]|nr:bifunctional nuclease family protein [Muribaculaceae bacterium]MBQ5697500.1 bifunctional nuclease family protein [Muribaculaceae bacterium]
MENRCKLNVVGITYSQIERGVYAIILQQENTNRRLPIVIGTSEAQSIECKLQNIKTPRPLTHDLMISCLRNYGVEITEIYIRRLPNGVFTADLKLSSDEKTIIMDSRSSDAIALALRSDAPIYTSQEVMDEAGFDVKDTNKKQEKAPVSYSEMSIDELNKMLQIAVENEQYEEASRIKKEIDNKSE